MIADLHRWLIAMIKKNKNLLSVTAFLYSFPSLVDALRLRSRLSFSASGAFIKRMKLCVVGHHNIVLIHPENRLTNCSITLIGNNLKVEIERHCILQNLDIWIEDDGGEIFIGYRTTIEGAHLAATEGQKITIGEDCMLSHGIEIRNGDSHAIFDTETGSRINYAEPVIVGNHIWMGADSKVLKGVNIADGAIVAAGSIVTKSFEGSCVIAGVPAQVVRTNIRWERERQHVPQNHSG